MIDDVMVQQFAALYKGRTDAWGSIEGMCKKSPVTTDSYRLHLEGKVSLGVYMLMPDATCYFAAIDLDIQDWDKAKAIKAGLEALGINGYISASRSKGFHIGMFAETKFIAKDIRKICKSVLDKLGLQKCEVFPKQDQLDKMIPYGNYINLPNFSIGRPYLSDEKTVLPLAQALFNIKRTSDEAVAKALALLPPDKVNTPAPVNEPGGKKKKKHPPCVEMLLQGVSSGARDDAAFALARHYLDQNYTEDEVLALLKTWDTRNKPPLGDDRILEQKLMSAKKGYAFGCNSIKGGNISPCCVGEDHCDWLTDNRKEKKKNGLLDYKSFYEDDNYIYEEVATISRSHEVIGAEFLRYEKQTRKIVSVKEINVGDKTYLAMVSEEVAFQAVVLATGVEEYENTIKLVEDIKTHIRKYCDLPESFLEFAAWYVLMSWVYTRLPSMCYLRFLGDFGTGKSRALDIVGGLCYKRMRLGGAVTTAPLFRMMKKYEGSLIIDEADLGKSDTTNEIVKILNSGIEKGTPIMRCTKDDPDNMQVFPCFGPKAFATRMRFQDDALESRCLTAVMEESDRTDIPSYLAKEHHEAQIHLRNKLLLWRFDNMTRIPEEISEITNIDLGNIEGRLKQVCIPFAMVFQDMPETLDRFRTFLKGYSKELRAARSDSEQGQIIYALFKTAALNGKELVTISAVTETAVNQLKMEIKDATITKTLHSMKVKTARKRVDNARVTLVIWENKLMQKLYRKYLNDLTPTPEKDSEESQFLELLGFDKK